MNAPQMEKAVAAINKGLSLVGEVGDLPGKRRPRELRRLVTKVSYLVMVVVPTVLAAVYFAFFASDRYVAGAGFAVRGMDSGGMDLLGSFTGLAANGSTTSDSYILLKFLKSRDIVEKLSARMPLRDIFANGEADYFSRLDSDLDIERVVEYWSKHIRTSFDTSSGILTFDVEAFTPSDAAAVAKAVLDEARNVVNALSAQAREDAVSYAESEVERAELRLKTALDAVRKFRETEKAIDPASAARIQMELIGGLEKNLTAVNARIAALTGEVGAESPSMRNLKRQAQAIQSEIARQRSQMGSDGQTNEARLTDQLAAFESLEVERDFAQKTYISSLASLEKARVEADRQQRYLAIYSLPAQPEYPLYPRRFLNILLVLGGLTVIWGILTLIGWSVRDHMT